MIKAAFCLIRIAMHIFCINLSGKGNHRKEKSCPEMPGLRIPIKRNIYSDSSVRPFQFHRRFPWRCRLASLSHTPDILLGGAQPHPVFHHLIQRTPFANCYSEIMCLLDFPLHLLFLMVLLLHLSFRQIADLTEQTIVKMERNEQINT